LSSLEELKSDLEAAHGASESGGGAGAARRAGCGPALAHALS